MDPNRWKRIEALYHAALARDAARREQFLTEECDGDDELRREVESLLEQDLSGKFLEEPAWEGASELFQSPDAPSGSWAGAPDPRIGRTFLQYRIVERLGAGGMGVVYKAEDTVLGRTVALKFVSEEAMGDPEVRTRLMREAQASAAFDHPNVCHVHGVHEEGGRAFIAMAFIDGPSLADKIADGPLDLQEALTIAEEVALGLQEAHEHDIVHRDIKPQNIMLTAKGRVVILDFGLAQITGRSKITKSGSTMGTPAYMSPEQLLGETVDRRTDTWSLGCVLYEMLTQHTPFDSEYPQAMAYAIIHEPHEPARELRPDLPASVDAILARALAKKPDQRYSEAKELIADLREVIRYPRAEPGTVAPPAQAHRGLSRRQAAWIGLGGALAAGGAAALFLRSGAARPQSLVILPFETAEGAEDSDYLGEGIAEGLIANLARASDLRVLSRDAAFRYQGRDRDARTIGADLGVDAVLKGRITPQGEALEVSAELVDATDGSVIWTERFYRRAGDLLNLDREMGSGIAERLRLRLDGHPIQEAAPTTQSPEAYRLYLLGRYHWSRRDDSLLTARDYFQQAVEVDPDYALAWAGLADAYLMLGGWSILAPGDSYPRAARAARRAIELGPALAEPYATLGYVQVVYERDWTNARAHFEESLRLQPEYATGHHWFGFYYMTVGDSAQSLVEIRRAHALDPLSPVINVELLSYFLFFAKQYEESEEAARKALEIDPSLGYAYSLIGRSLAARGDADRARQALEKSLTLTGNSIFGWKFAGLAYAQIDEPEAARAMLEKIVEASKSAYVNPQMLGLIHAALGEHDHALELFEASVRERAFIASWMRDPALETFAQDPRFHDLMNGIGLQA